MIKGGFYGKLLKQFFIISLISCFTLLVNSSVSADCTTPNGISNTSFNCYEINYYEGLDFSNSSYSYYMGTISDSGFNFSSYYNNVFMYSTNKSKVLYNVLNYWWQSDGLHYTRRYDENTNIEHGKINGFYVCSDTTATFPGNAYNYLSSRSNCVYHDGFNKLSQYLIDINNPSFACVYNRNSNKDINCVLCLNGGSSICFDLSNKTVIEEAFYSSSEVANLAIKNPFSSKHGTSFIPSTGSRLGGRLITSSGYTNSQMVEAYECLGLHPSLCYGGFPITNIFQPGEQFEDFTGYIAGEGASVFDLYNLYSGSFSSLNQFLNTVLIRYQNGQINSFITEPKALLMLGSQLNVAGLKTSYISTYCDLLLNKNNDSIYTGNSVDDLRARSCVRSQKINDSLRNSEGNDIVGQGSNVGIFGFGDDVDFDPETFFSNMLGKFESGLDNISTGTAVGFIPGYIVIFTLALIFIRMISH